jgi:hypothetical protein
MKRGPWAPLDGNEANGRSGTSFRGLIAPRAPYRN